MKDIIAQAQKAREAALQMQAVSTQRKDAALFRIAEALVRATERIMKANERDLRAAREKGMSEAFIERLTLTPARIEAMADGARQVAGLPDPVGIELQRWTQADGLEIVKKSVPLGAVAIIYESRPNVTVDAAALTLKSGNAVVLRGGSDAFLSNCALMDALTEAVRAEGLPEGCVSLVMDTSREAAEALMKMNGLIDVLIPRGGKGLIESVVRSATVPVIQTGDGICHIYVDGKANLEMGNRIAVSAKVSRPSVCNSAETLLVDQRIAEVFLPECLEALRQQNVEIRGCARTKAICPWVIDAQEQDFDTEYNDLIYSVRVVDGVDQAIDHINHHGTRHSEAIVTEDRDAAQCFLTGVDAAAVYHNASTRFTDGGVFGFGAEIGISNQKLHARGPMGLRELTTYKYEIHGDGQIR